MRVRDCHTVRLVDAAGKITFQTEERWLDIAGVLTLDEGLAATAQLAQIDTNEQTIGQQVEAALVSNATYLAIASPTTAQAVAQVRKLTQQTNGIIRLLRRKLDATS
jgi:hypothetical protein